jgi:hypothetical protein
MGIGKEENDRAIMNCETTYNTPRSVDHEPHLKVAGTIQFFPAQNAS